MMPGPDAQGTAVWKEAMVPGRDSRQMEHVGVSNELDDDEGSEDAAES